MNGRLAITLSFQGGVDLDGLARYCYVFDKNIEAPTLRLHPGDELVLTLKNDLAPGEPGSTEHHHGTEDCAGKITAASTNLVFHGLNIPPICHQDEVTHTTVQPGDPGFEYRVRLPATQPPGLYWYHPRPHEFSEGQVLRGASGALVVEEIAHARPEVAGLPERILILRDQATPSRGVADADDAKGKDISLNFVSIASPLSLPQNVNWGAS